MNRHTLYSTAIVDISEGATLTLPNIGDRYTSTMLINQDHYINEALREHIERQGGSDLESTLRRVLREELASTNS